MYGWPIPQHLKAAVAAFALLPAPTKPNNVPKSPDPTVPIRTLEEWDARDNSEKSRRLAAGMGKLEEIDLGPSATERNIERTEAARKKLESGQSMEEQVERVRLGQNGKPRRPRQRRNSEDVRRDQLVEAVLREAKRTSSSSILFCVC